MTLYRVYYKNGGRTYCCYIEVADRENGIARSARSKVAEVRATAKELHGIETDTITRIVKDC